MQGLLSDAVRVLLAPLLSRVRVPRAPRAYPRRPRRGCGGSSGPASDGANLNRLPDGGPLRRGDVLVSSRRRLGTVDCGRAGEVGGEMQGALQALVCGQACVTGLIPKKMNRLIGTEQTHRMRHRRRDSQMNVFRTGSRHKYRMIEKGDGHGFRIHEHNLGST